MDKIKEKSLKATLLRTFLGGLEGIRTLDPHNANVVRSQLRYKPVDYPRIIRRAAGNVKG